MRRSSSYPAEKNLIAINCGQQTLDGFLGFFSLFRNQSKSSLQNQLVNVTFTALSGFQCTGMTFLLSRVGATLPWPTMPRSHCSHRGHACLPRLRKEQRMSPVCPIPAARSLRIWPEQSWSCRTQAMPYPFSLAEPPCCPRTARIKKGEKPEQPAEKLLPH